jgi:hypothetical protein
MFSFQSVNSGWGQSLRGGRSLGAVLAKDRIGLVSDVAACPGHVALLLHSSSLLCVFDAVPADRQLTDLEDRALTHVLTQPASASTLSSSVVPSEHSLRIQRVVLISPHSTAPIINLWFESDPTTTTTAAAATPSASTASGAGGAPSTSPTAATLRLVVVQADGWLHAWRWNATTWRWNPYAPVLLPPSRDPRSFGAGRVAPRRRLTAVTASTPHVAGSSSSSSSSSSFGPPPSVSAGARIIFWCETYIRDDSSAGTNTNAKQQQPKNEGKKDEAKGGKSEREATPTPKGGAIKPATKKKKEFLRLCWSELWFEEAPRPVSVAGPAKPPAYRPQGNTSSPIIFSRKSLYLTPGSMSCALCLLPHL